MLAVRGRKVAEQPPPVYGVLSLAAADSVTMEGYREGLREEIPRGPLGQVAVERKVYGGHVGFSGRHEGGAHQRQVEAPGGGVGASSGDEGRRVGRPGLPPRHQ